MSRPTLRTCPAEAQLFQGPTCWLSRLSERALVRLDIWLLRTPDLRALAQRTVLSRRPRATAGLLCPAQTPHRTVCSSNVEEVGGDMGWERRGEESREEVPFVRERPVFGIGSLFWNREGQSARSWGQGVVAPQEKPRDELELRGGQGRQEEGCSYPRPVYISESPRGLPATLPGSQLLAGKGGGRLPSRCGGLGGCRNVFTCRRMPVWQRVGWRASVLAPPSESTPPLTVWRSTRRGHSLCLQCSGTERRGKPR